MTVQEELDRKQSEYERISKQIDSVPSGPVRVELKRKRNGLTGEMVTLRQRLIQEQVSIALAGGTPKEIPTLKFGK